MNLKPLNSQITLTDFGCQEVHQGSSPSKFCSSGRPCKKLKCKIFILKTGRGYLYYRVQSAVLQSAEY